jgi:FkbM family methyltransferase
VTSGEDRGGAAGAVQRAAASMADRLGGRDAAWRRALSPWFSRLLQAISGGRGVPAVLNGEPFRVDARYRAFLHPDYEAAVARVLRGAVRPGATCIDVGAHIGAYALQLARWVGPAGRVIAFEPNRGTAAVLRRHLRMNGFESIVRVEASAVGAGEGEAALYGESGSGLSRLGAPNPGAPAPSPRRGTVAVTTIDRYCTASRLSPDWILIDAEGYEFDVLSGARATLAARGPALSIVVEMHPDLWASAGWTRARGEALLAALGRAPVPVEGQADPLGSHGPVLLV